MARVAPIQNSLIGGEISPRLYGRSDTEKYGASAKTIRNVFIAPHGGGYSRPGFGFIQETKDSSKFSRLIDFEFSDQQAYAIEMGEGYFRFYRDGGYILDTDELITNGTFPSNITGWTDKSTGTGAIAWDGAGAMNLVPGASGAAIAEQALTFVTDGVDISLELEIVSGAAAADGLIVRVGSTSGASDIFSETHESNGVKGDGRSTVVDIPLGTTTVYLQFEKNTTTTAKIDNVTSFREIVEIAHDYLEGDLRDIQYAQTADVVYMTHPDYPVGVMSRFSHTNWTFEDVFFYDGPYAARNNDSAKTLTTTGTYTVGGTCTLTAVGHSPFSAVMVGESIRLEDEGDNTKYFWASIAGYSSPTVVTATVQSAVPVSLQAAATFKWHLQAFTAANGYPAALGLSAQRLWFASTTAQPQSFWGSVIAELDTFSIGLEDDLSILFSIAAKKPHKIQWIAGLGAGLMVGTRGGEWQIHGGGLPMSPTNIQASPQTSRGSDRIQPIEAGYALLMVQKFGHKLRELKSEFQVDGYVSPDLMIMAEHIARDEKIVDIAYQAERESIVWVVLADGGLAAMTYEPEQQVIAWHRHDTQGTFEAVTSIPGENADDVYVIVNRTIGGTTKRFVEILKPTVFDGIKNAFFVDSGLSYTGPSYTVTAASVANPCVVRIDIGAESYSFSGDGNESLEFSGVLGMTELNGNVYSIQSSSLVGGTVYDVTLNLDASGFTAYTSGGAAQFGIKTVSGLDHLEGETVSILANGGVENDQVVASGSISVELPSSAIHVGLSYLPIIEFLEPEAGSQNGTARGKLKRYNDIKVLLSESAGCKINGQQVPFRRINDEMGKPVDLFSGVKSVENLGWDREAFVTIEQPQPLPMNVLALTGTLTTSDS